jgi:nitroreductase
VVRGFTDQPVPREVLERVLSPSAWAPSGSNLQLWNIYVLTGAPLAQLKELAVERVAACDDWEAREFVMYPPNLKSPYGERRSAFGKERYSALGIAREDHRRGVAAKQHIVDRLERLTRRYPTPSSSATIVAGSTGRVRISNGWTPSSPRSAPRSGRLSGVRLCPLRASPARSTR